MVHWALPLVNWTQTKPQQSPAYFLSHVSAHVETPWIECFGNYMANHKQPEPSFWVHLSHRRDQGAVPAAPTLSDVWVGRYQLSLWLLDQATTYFTGEQSNAKLTGLGGRSIADITCEKKKKRAVPFSLSGVVEVESETFTRRLKSRQE